MSALLPLKILLLYTAAYAFPLLFQMCTILGCCHGDMLHFVQSVLISLSILM